MYWPYKDYVDDGSAAQISTGSTTTINGGEFRSFTVTFRTTATLYFSFAGAIGSDGRMQLEQQANTGAMQHVCVTGRCVHATVVAQWPGDQLY